MEHDCLRLHAFFGRCTKINIYLKINLNITKVENDYLTKYLSIHYSNIALRIPILNIYFVVKKRN